MIKLYVMYLFIGCYLFVESDIIWSFSSGVNHFIAGLALVSSLSCSIAATLSISNNNIRAALITGIISLVGAFPFGIYWLVFRYQNDYFNILDAENTLMLIAVILYFSSFIYTITMLIRYKQNSILIKKSLRLFLMSVATIVFGLQIFLFFAK